MCDQSGGQRQLPQPAFGGLLGQRHASETAGFERPAVTAAQLSVADENDRRQVRRITTPTLDIGQGCQLMTDQQAGQIIGLRGSSQFTGQPKAAGTEHR